MAKRGRPKHVPTKAFRELAELGAAQGTPHHDIAKLLGIGIHQLREHYGDELKLSKTRANLKMGGRLYNTGMAGNVTAMIFWLKAQAGWREPPQSHLLAGPDGGAIPIAAAAVAITDDDAMKTYLRLCREEI